MLGGSGKCRRFVAKRDRKVPFAESDASVNLAHFVFVFGGAYNRALRREPALVSVPEKLAREANLRLVLRGAVETARGIHRHRAHRTETRLLHSCT